MDRKIIGIKLINTIEVAPINESDFNDNDVVNDLMNKVRDDIFALGHYCGCSEAIPIFEDNEQ